VKEIVARGSAPEQARLRELMGHAAGGTPGSGPVHRMTHRLE
jgi:hypothetical protein